MRSFERSCLGKRPYLSQPEADAAAKNIRKAKKLARFTGLQSYQCRFCRYWHLGHSTRKK